jgi:hypothetical protein
MTGTTLKMAWMPEMMKAKNTTDSRARMSLSEKAGGLRFVTNTEPRTKAMTSDTVSRDKLYDGDLQ